MFILLVLINRIKNNTPNNDLKYRWLYFQYNTNTNHMILILYIVFFIHIKKNYSSQCLDANFSSD